MNCLKIHNNYFLKKANSKTNQKKGKRKNNVLINTSNIIYNKLKNNDLFNGQTNVKSAKFNDFQIINNTISTNNQDSITTTHIALDSDNSINSNYNPNNKGVYIQKLEKQLSQLLEYKELCEKRIKELNPKEILPLTIDSLNDNYFPKKIKKSSSKVLNTSYSNNHIKIDLNNLKNYEKTIELNLNKTNDNFYKNKYENLYKKYTKLYNDFKNMNTNTDNMEINKLKSNIYKLQSENDNIKEKYNKEKIINDELKIKINNLEKSIQDNDDTNNAKKWKDQAEMLRKDLVLSQALVNSLKSEIELLNKKNNNKNKNIKRCNSYIDKRINNSFDYNILPYNNNNNNFKNINSQDISLLNENNFLKKSLYNKNILISNMLEENNKLNNIINLYVNNNIKNLKKDNNNNSNNNIPQNNVNIEEMKNNLSQYENKFVYFNNYISNIKKQIFKLHQDMIELTNNIIKDNTKKENDNNNDILLSENFEKEIKVIKDKLNDINIDFYNLDYSNDIKCIESNIELIKIISDELKKLLLNNANNNFINKKEINSIIDLFELSKALIKDESLKKTLNDIFNITQNINKIYKEKYLNNKNNNNIIDEQSNNLNKILITQEKELELIKKSLFDIINKTNKAIKRKTYYIINNYNNKLNSISNQINDYNENINYNQNFTENYSLNTNFRNQNKRFSN